MKKPSGPQSDIKTSQVFKAQAGDFRQKGPVPRENRGTPVQYPDYSDDLTLNDADIVEIDRKYIPVPLNDKNALGDYADDLTLNDAEITDLVKQSIPVAESYGIDDLRDYTDDLTLNDADIVEIDSKDILRTDNDLTAYTDDLTLNNADIGDIESLRSRADAGAGDDLRPNIAEAHDPGDDYSDDLSLNNADICDIDSPGPIRADAGFGDRRDDLNPDSHDPSIADDAAAFEDYSDDLSLNNADVIELDSPDILHSDHSEPDDRDIIDMDDAAVIDTEGADILSDIPAEIIELMYCTENDKAEIRNDESIMPEIIKEVMRLTGDDDNDDTDGSLSRISDTDNLILCPTDETDFLKEQNELIELTDISTDFIDDNEDTVVNFEKRELKESSDIIELTDMAIPLPDDNEDTVDLEEKNTFSEKGGNQDIGDLDADDEEEDGKKLFLSENREDASSFMRDFDGLSDDGESDLSEDIEAVADLINIIVHFPDDDTVSADDAAEKKKKDLLELLERDIGEDTDIPDSAGYEEEEYDEYDEYDEAREETDAAFENDRTDILRAEDEDSDHGDPPDTGADIGTEKDNRDVPDFYFSGETDGYPLMEKDLVDLLEMDSEPPDESVSENRAEFHGIIKNEAEIQEPPLSEPVPEQITDPQKIPRKSRDTLAEYLEDIVTDIICEKIDQMVIDQQRIVDVIEKAVLKEKIKLIRDLTADG